MPILTRCSLNSNANLGMKIKQQVVPVKRLDDFQIKDVVALKIDVEGHELAVILGARETIAACKPLLVIEIEERHHPGQSSEIINYIKSLGYDCAYLDVEGNVMSADKFDFPALQDVNNLPNPIVGGGGIYVNDFIFLPR
jgi:hypothetical protein